uniref:ADP-ribosyl cyclase/cyclic ADP-ribose hydrolase n=1 Tax=Cajanus cajan TaxID=3821 RepID=A0A151UBZ6_CAJCA|nr:TMV resistance protein N [Cajanus cajan]
MSSFTYDVFLSFRGSDTRYAFTGNLYKALRDRGIHTFIDEEDLQRGHEIKPSLINAIQHSRMAILVLSQNYASSSHCLDELVTIIDSVKAKGRFILPIFYDVDPSHVRHQTGTYGEALAMHQERFTRDKENRKDNVDRLHKWKMALNQAASLSGNHYKLGTFLLGRNEYEHEFIGKIVKEVSDKINRTPLHVADYPVGLDSRVQKVKSLLEFGSDIGVHAVGIYGIGGMGKTTLARAIYNSIADQFEGLCFLDNVRENTIKHGLVHLQEMLLSEVVGDKDIKIGSVSRGISIIKHRLQRKKVFIILDDVDKLEQLRATVGGPNWFGSGSRVIITTRDKHLLASYGVDRIYEVRGLDEEEALELLSWNAFKDDKVDPRYKDISNQAVAYASGLPLALEVVGSLLFGKSVKEWESALDQYKKIPHKSIQDILKVSYNALEEDQKKIFLDIACCLKGPEVAEVEEILCAHYGVCMKYGIGVLVDKSLIKIKNGCVTLHELIEVMGKEIDRKESPKELGKRKRLWFHEDIIQVLAENIGTSVVEIICLDFPLFEGDEMFIEWNGEAFKKMENLKTLIIRNCHFSKGPKHLPNSLRVLECLSKAILNFDETECLTQIPDISGLRNLVKLSFECCENLVSIHDSVGFLDKLRILSAFGCSKLTSFPPIKLTSLEQLELSSCSSLESFPEILGRMENITQLELKYTPIKEFPFSFRNLTGLRDLVLVGCGNVQLPSSIVMLPELAEIFALECKGWILPKEDKEKVSSIYSNVKCLCLTGCNLSDEYFPMALALFGNVKELELSSNNFTFLPECIKECRSLTLLNLDNCERLREIRGIPPNLEHFSGANCKSLSFWCTAMLLNQELHEAGNTMFCFPGSRIPDWFEHQSIGPSISFWFRDKFPTMALCFVIGPMGKDSILFRPIMTINGVEIQFLTEKRICFDFPSLTDHVFIIGTKYTSFGDNLDEVLSKNEWNHVVVSIGIGFEPTPEKMMIVKRTGFHIIKPESSTGDIEFTDPYNNHPIPSLEEKHKLLDIGDCHKQFIQQQTTLVSLEPHVGQGRESFSLLHPQACQNNVISDSNSTRISSIAGIQGIKFI